jgi:hypothetical protein
MSLQSFRSAVLLAALLLGAATVPLSLSAQQRAIDDRGSPAPQTLLVATAASIDTSRASSAAGPRIAPVGFSRRVAASSPAPARPIEDTSRGNNRNVAMMGVGAAALGLGLIIGGQGGTIVALTGGVVGLVGLYRYLR